MKKLRVTLTDTQTDNELVIQIDLDQEDYEILQRSADNPVEYEGRLLALLNDVMLVQGKVID